MYIKKIKGNFGKLKGEVLQFTDGLNVIHRNNEWGKTTAVALIKTMFYGLNTSQRDKKDALSLKTKYVSSGEYACEMVLVTNNRTINISRSVSGKSESFNAFYEDDYSKLEYGSKDLGKSLLGVSEEAFENSALIEVDNRGVSSSDELYDLIISLSTTGDSEQNFKTAMKNIKNHKSSITNSHDIDTLEKEIANLKISASKREMYESEITRLHEGYNSTKLYYDNKKTEYDNMFKYHSVHKIEEETRQNITITEAQAIVANIEKEVVSPDLLEIAQKDYDNYLKTDETEYRLRIEISQKKMHIENKITEINDLKDKNNNKKAKFKLNVMPFLSAVCFTVLSVITSFIDVNVSYLSYGLGLIAVVSLIFSFGNDKIDEHELNSKYDKVITALENEIKNLEKQHKTCASKTMKMYQLMLSSAEKIGGSKTVSKEDAYAQISYAKDINERYKKSLTFLENLKFNAIDDNDKIVSESEEVSKLQAEVLFLEKQLDVLRHEVARCEATLDMLPKLNDLYEEIRSKQKEIEETDYNLSSIELAASVLTQANDSLASRLSPKICKRASEYLSKITSDKYDDVILKKNFDALCKATGEYTHLDKLRLSTGTTDQLYFSLRLAICDVLLPRDTPIILDDPFVFYDDERTFKTMKLLKELSQTRQILLFTCRNREQEILPML